MDGITLDIDNSAMQDLIRQANATPKQARAAVVRALRRLQKHVISQSKKAVAQQLGVPQKALQKRYRSRPPDENGMEVWAGTWAIAPESFGKPRGTKTGVKVGRWPVFTGAFYAQVFRSSGPGIYIRKSSRHLAPSLYPGLGPAGGRGRFPVYRVRVPIEDAVVRSFDGHESEFQAFFLRQLENELRYETQMRGRA